MDPPLSNKPVPKGTRELLGLAYVEHIPKAYPELRHSTRSSSTHETRLKDTLSFIDQVLRRGEIAPFADHCLSIYASCIKALLRKSYKNDEEKRALLSAVWTFERDMDTIPSLTRPPEFDAHADLVPRLVDYHRSKLLARYQDYISYVCGVPKCMAEAESLHDWNHYWLHLSKKMKEENDSSNTSGSEAKTTLAVFRACEYVHVDFYTLCASICETKPSGSVGILQAIAEGQWWQLLDMLSQDLRELPAITAAKVRNGIPVLDVIINAIIDEYFWRDADHPALASKWSLKECSDPIAIRQRRLLDRAREKYKSMPSYELENPPSCSRSRTWAKVRAWRILIHGRDHGTKEPRKASGLPIDEQTWRDIVYEDFLERICEADKDKDDDEWDALEMGEDDQCESEEDGFVKVETPTR